MNLLGRLVGPTIVLALMSLPACEKKFQNAGGSWLFCTFGPEATLFPGKVSRDGCSGSSHIQIKRYQCVPESKVANATRSFLREIIEKGRKACQELCEDRSSGCTGFFKAPGNCGMAVGQEYASDTGKERGCHQGCDGTAFAFCSVFPAGVLKVNKRAVLRRPANCVCSKRA